MHFLHEGLPMPTRKAVVIQRPAKATPPGQSLQGEGLRRRILATLAHPNVASKHWIIRQYDHEVQGGSVIKPLTGPLQAGPSDAAVLRPKLAGHRGVAIGCGLAPFIDDPYQMALASMDEAIRNVVAVGADPKNIAILDNFCWPSVDDEQTLGTLVRACEACRDAALAYRIPFISGKDSLNNQFTDQETGQVIRIPPTLLISAIAVIADVRRCVTMDLKRPGDPVLLLQAHNPADPASLARAHQAVSALIAAGKVSACHDISDGGLPTAAAEMCIASGLGMIVSDTIAMNESAFAPTPGQYLLELAGDLKDADIGDSAKVTEFARVDKSPKLTIAGNLEIPVSDLTTAWRGTLDW